MTKINALLLSATLLAMPLAVSGQAQAQQDTKDAPAAGGVAASAAEKQICKKDKEIGSRLASKKVCRTKAEWDEFYRQQRAETEQMQRNDMATKTPK
ncbi:hypothetical protein [Niveispirillum sp.]|uniref:hypothetical protein n=1 Tax=Niveispirillum sp. TaxID=1917217 RepID=UPI001B4C6AB2|nr:hypothetical protein [Niveispirillum sp.]MBP7334658.1 hypothetical protein [Niveispirillum sp.]